MRKPSLITMALAGALAVAGCSSSSGSSAYTPPTGPPVKTFDIAASNFAFAPNTLTSPAGVIQINLKSDGLHNLVIEGLPGFQIEATSGNTVSGKVKLAKGKYTFYCDVAGHRAQGMEGTLTVT